MNFKKLIWIFAALLLVALPLAYSYGVEDDFDRANSASLGTATNGNTWTESGETGSCFFEISANKLKSNSDGCSLNGIYAELVLSSNIGDEDFLVIDGFTANSGSSGAGVILFFNDTQEIGRLYASSSDGFFSNGTAQSTGDNLLPVAGGNVYSVNLTLNLVNMTINLRLNTTTSVANFRLLNDTTQIDRIRVGYYGPGTSDSNFFNYEAINTVEDGVAPSDPALQEFTITSGDDFTKDLLTSFNVSISNGSDTFDFQTHNGTIIINNRTIEKFNVTYNFTFDGNDSLGDFFNKTYIEINLTDAGEIQGNLSQSFVVLNVTDLLAGLRLSSFTAQDNFTERAGTNGYLILPSKPTHQVVNVSSSQYPKQTHEYDITAGQNLTLLINMSPQFQFYLRREADNSVFDVQGTNTTRLTIFCPEKNILLDFKNNSAESLNTTQLNTTVDCEYSFMKMDVTYPDSSYFRSLIPPTTQKNVTWWLLDLNQDTGVQINIDLVDLTGQFTNGLLRIKKAIDQNTGNIIEQFFDIESSTVNYLLKDGFYTVSVEDKDNNERQLGTLITDAAGTKTITLPNIPFYPDKVLFDNISWSYTFNITAGILRLQYEDKTTNTTLLRWRVYNGSNASNTQLLQEFSSTNPGLSTTFTFNGASGNTTYFTDLYAEHALLGFNITEQRTWGDFTGYLFPFEGFSGEDADNIKFYGSAIFLVVWGLLFSARHVGLGLASTLIWAVIFRWIGWFPINLAWLALIGLIVFFGWVVEAMKK